MAYADPWIARCEDESCTAHGTHEYCAKGTLESLILKWAWARTILLGAYQIRRVMKSIMIAVVGLVTNTFRKPHPTLEGDDVTLRFRSTFAATVRENKRWE